MARCQSQVGQQSLSSASRRQPDGIALAMPRQWLQVTSASHGESDADTWDDMLIRPRGAREAQLKVAVKVPN